jgi:hypothetical protein
MKTTGLRSLVLGGLIAVLVMSLAGCGFIAQKAAEKATGVSVDNKSGQVTVTGKNGEKATFSGSDNKLPDNLPSDVPHYAGTVKSSAAVNTPQGKSFTFVIETTDDVATVADWTTSQLKAQGWTIDNTVDVNGSKMVSAKKSASQIQVTVTNENGKTQVMTVAMLK